MKFLKSSVIVASAVLSWSACAETVKITNIGHGYYSGALYIAKHRGSACSDEIIPYRLTDRGMVIGEEGS